MLFPVSTSGPLQPEKVAFCLQIEALNVEFLVNIYHFVNVHLSSFYHISWSDSTFLLCQPLLVKGELQHAAERCSLPELLLLHCPSVNTPASLLRHVSPLFRNKHTQTVSIIPVIFASCWATSSNLRGLKPFVAGDKVCHHGAEHQY